MEKPAGLIKCEQVVFTSYLAFLFWFFLSTEIFSVTQTHKRIWQITQLWLFFEKKMINSQIGSRNAEIDKWTTVLRLRAVHQPTANYWKGGPLQLNKLKGRRQEAARVVTLNFSSSFILRFCYLYTELIIQIIKKWG